MANFMNGGSFLPAADYAPTGEWDFSEATVTLPGGVVEDRGSIALTDTTNQIVTGDSGNLTTVNFPASSGAVTITMPNTTTTLVGTDTTNTLTNKTLTAPVITAPTITGATTIGTGATITTPTIVSPTITGSGYMQVAVVSLAGAAWHTGNGTADFLSWQAPALRTIVARVVVDITTKSTGAATADIGTTATNDHTGSDNLLDGLDIGTSAGTFDNFGTPGSNGKFLQGTAASTWVTFHANADPTGTVGNAYIFYFTA